MESCFFNDLFAYDLNALQNADSNWVSLRIPLIAQTTQDGAIPPARTNHSMVSYNDQLYLYDLRQFVRELFADRHIGLEAPMALLGLTMCGHISLGSTLGRNLAKSGTYPAHERDILRLLSTILCTSSVVGQRKAPTSVI